jgi:hypothetical protein
VIAGGAIGAQHRNPAARNTQNRNTETPTLETGGSGIRKFNFKTGVIPPLA